MDMHSMQLILPEKNGQKLRMNNEDTSFSSQEFIWWWFLKWLLSSATGLRDGPVIQNAYSYWNRGLQHLYIYICICIIVVILFHYSLLDLNILALTQIVFNSPTGFPKSGVLLKGDIGLSTGMYKVYCLGFPRMGGFSPSMGSAYPDPFQEECAI